MSLFSIGKFLSGFLGLGTFSVTSLALSIPETHLKREFKLSDCTMTNWGGNNSVFKCLKEKDGSSWAFFLPSAWNTWFYGRTGRAPQGGSNDLSNTVLTIEEGHKQIKITSEGKSGVNKTLEVVRVGEGDKTVRGYAPAALSKPTSEQYKKQVESALQSITSEVKRTQTSSR